MWKGHFIEDDIGGFDSPSIGSVYIGWFRYDQRSTKRSSNQYGFSVVCNFSHLNVAENVGYGLKKQKLPNDEINRRVEEALALVDLEGFGARESHALRWTTTARSTGKSVDYEAEGASFRRALVCTGQKIARDNASELENCNAPLVSLLFSLHMIKKKH